LTLFRQPEWSVREKKKRRERKEKCEKNLGHELVGKKGKETCLRIPSFLFEAGAQQRRKKKGREGLEEAR